MCNLIMFIFPQQSPYDNDSSDKENVNPALVQTTGSRPAGRGARRPRRLPDIPKKAAGSGECNYL